jgi:hypothetical protein
MMKSGNLMSITIVTMMRIMKGVLREGKMERKMTGIAIIAKVNQSVGNFNNFSLTSEILSISGIVRTMNSKDRNHLTRRMTKTMMLMLTAMAAEKLTACLQSL